MTENLSTQSGPLRVGIGGPVGSGKTALTERLCKLLRDAYNVAAITNDIYTKEDAEFLTRAGALAPERIAGVETGGCPHTAIREDASINLAAVAAMNKKFPGLEIVFIESRPFVFSNLKIHHGLNAIARFIVETGGLPSRPLPELAQ